MSTKGDAKAVRGARATLRMMEQFDATDFAEATVLDIGANVGHVARYMIERGAGLVIGYEPHPAARRQIPRLRALKVIPAAVTSTGGGGSLFITNSSAEEAMGYYCNSKLRAAPRGVSHRVRTVAFGTELAQHQPRGVKIDIEGGEYDLLLRTPMPACVEWTFVEFHWMKRLGAYLLPHVVRKMMDAGLVPLALPNIKADFRTLQSNSFFGFEMANFRRGVTLKRSDAALLKAFERMGVSAYRDGYRPRDPMQRELFELCYGRRGGA